MLQPSIRLSSHLSYRKCISAAFRGYATLAETLAESPVIPEASIQSTSSLDAFQSRTDDEVSRRLPSVLRSYKPRTPGLRHLRRPVNDHLWKGGPHRPLTYPKIGHAKGGRNNTGRVTVRHRGGGARRRIRTVDFHRKQAGEQLVERIEYDPNRSGHIALLTHKETGTKSYIIAPEGLRAGDVVQSFRAGIPDDLMKAMGGRIDVGILASKTVFRGNCLPLRLIPPGTQVHCVGMLNQGKATFCRSAGTFATVIGKDESTERNKFTVVRLQSGEVRKVHRDACATVGVVSNPMHQFRQLGKAGRSRWLNIRPTVRGLAMNAGTHLLQTHAGRQILLT
jgi:ribosomal protein L2